MSPINAGRTARHRVSMRVAAMALGLTAAIGGVSGVAMAEDAPTPSTSSDIILTVGANETQRVVSWYASADTSQVVEVSTTSDFTAGVVDFPGVVSANTVNGGFNGHATISGLQENVTYYYRVGGDGAWSPAYSFKTQDFEGDFDFLFFGDPQIGAGNVTSDTAGWVDTLNVAVGANPNAELFVSGGDQVETANTESQWDGFLAPTQLKNYPWAPTIGNHDVGGKAYEQHFYTPNTDRNSAFYTGASNSGGDYWYMYKDVLFIDINSNAYSGAADPAHVQYVTDVVNAHPDAKYKVLVYHHSIYSPASHANDSDNVKRRVDFTTAFSDLGIDLVLQGHDHSYSRSYELKNGQKANAAEQPGASDVFTGPGGVIYLTANSASGSKYYGLTTPLTTGDYTADPLDPTGKRHNKNSVENQENTRTYVKVSVKHDQLVVQNVRSQASAGGAVGTTVDNVTIHPSHGNGQDIQVDVPAGAPGEFGWTIDGTNGLVNLGTAADHTDYFQATGSINPITVTDSRRSLAPWSLSGSVGDFTDGEKSFSGAYLGWTPSVIEAGIGANAGDHVGSSYDDNGAGLSVSRGLGWAGQGHPKGSAKLGADLDLKAPGSTEKGNYRATLTITAIS